MSNDNNVTDFFNGAAPARAEIVLPAGNFQETVDFFIDRLGFRMDSIAPADDPAVAQLSGYGLNVRIDSNHSGDAGLLCLRVSDEAPKPPATRITAPNGTRIEFKADIPTVALPTLQPSLCIRRLDEKSWNVGRAGMLYRDLITDRQGGRFIASHIRIPEGGPVPDNVHYHNIHFQLIYCYRGWVRLVYEDQGEPFVMQAGDCVLQPPLIRHRVLEASDGLEVIEVGCPAEHMTYLDHEMTLPTAQHRPDRDFGGQRYTLYRAGEANWQPAEHPNAESSDLGIAAATNRVVSARVLRFGDASATPATVEQPVTHDAQLAFWFVLSGRLGLSTADATQTAATLGGIELQAGDSLVVPSGMEFGLYPLGNDLELLEIVVPAT
jgi:mannose-6-phosphate isomerase-like protein (cupin superfamily)